MLRVGSMLIHVLILIKAFAVHIFSSGTIKKIITHHCHGMLTTPPNYLADVVILDINHKQKNALILPASYSFFNALCTTIISCYYLSTTMIVWLKGIISNLLSQTN